MKTTLDCLPCFYKQTLYTIRQTNSSMEVQQEALKQVAALLADLDLSLSPPENSVRVYDLIAEISSEPDPFRDLKKKDNEKAMALADNTREIINSASDPLRAAALLAIGGNIVDYGSHQDFDLESSLRQIMEQPLAIDDYDRFKEQITKSDNILYLADNCGEIVFDRLLIEHIEANVTLAVKEKPIINDALLPDAIACGIDRVCTVISNGTGCPGTPLSQCDPDFIKKFNQADMIISKGQGNFETLSENSREIFFLTSVKCPVVASHIADIYDTNKKIQVGDSILMRKGRNP